MNLTYTTFDFLAWPLWVFLIVDAIYDLKKGKGNWRIKVRLAIGIIGLIADLIFVLFKPFG